MSSSRGDRKGGGEAFQLARGHLGEHPACPVQPCTPFTHSHPVLLWIFECRGGASGARAHMHTHTPTCTHAHPHTHTHTHTLLPQWTPEPWCLRQKKKKKMSVPFTFQPLGSLLKCKCQGKSNIVSNRDREPALTPMAFKG